MNVWLKNKLSKRKENKKSSKIVQCIDICGTYKSYLVIKGWCADANNPVNVSVSTGTGKSLSLVAGRNESRKDVLAHLDLTEDKLQLGFLHVYDIFDAYADLIIKFHSERSEIFLPLDYTDTSEDLLIKECGSLGIQFVGDSDDVISYLDESLLPEPEPEPELEPEPEPEPETVNPIRHYVEAASLYKGKLGVIRGWCVDIETKKPIQINVNGEDASLKRIKHFHLSRPDVADFFSLNSDACEFGFLLLFEIQSNKNDNVDLTFNNGEYEVKLSVTLDNQVTKQYIENNLTDGELLSVADSKVFLLEKLGVSYLCDLKPELKTIDQALINLHIDSNIVFNDGCFFRGWIDDSKSKLAAIYVTDGNVISDNIFPNLVRNVRTDVNNAFEHLADDFESGFFCYTALKGYHGSLYALIVEQSGKVIKLPLPQQSIENDEVSITKQILSQVEPHSTRLFEVFEQHVAPSLKSVWVDRVSPPNINEVSVISYGKKVFEPICSIIVPLYGRYDFVLHQISQFELDEDFKHVELIYVIDDPRIEQAVKGMCDDISKLYNVSFKLVSCGRNLGFAGANNLGVEYATSDHLILLNSDVLPSTTGWLGRLLESYKQTPNVGAMGVKLVYEDESIQHIGMSFNKSREFGGIWLNEHPYKGFPTLLVPSIGLERVPTVTAACVMLEKSKYLKIGGFDTKYILGDFEDSDLCLKLLEHGYDNYILGTESLYHFERLSQSLVDQGDWKFKLTLLNGWQHTRRWDHLITSLQA